MGHQARQAHQGDVPNARPKTLKRLPMPRWAGGRDGSVLWPLHTVPMARAQNIIRPDGTVVRRKPVVGDMRWDGGRWTRWSGRRWARAAYSLRPERLRAATRLDQEHEVDEHKRQRVLALAVEDQVARNAASVVLDGPNGVVLSYRRRVSHLMHALLTVLTGGLWAVVWLAMALGRGEDRVRLEVDPWGNVWARPVAGA
jgi:hypothetical protein